MAQAPLYQQAYRDLQGDIRAQLRKQRLGQGLAFSKLLDRLPDKVWKAIEKAFQIAFEKLFMGGMPLIEASFSKGGAQLDHLRADFHLNKDPSLAGLHGLRQASRKRTRSASRWTGIESTVLGLLGIGLPDISIYLASILRQVYLIAQSYGFGYESREEKIYILRLIRLALDGSHDNSARSLALADLGQRIDQGHDLPGDFEEEIRFCATEMTQALVLSRAVMTLPVVGVVGGLYQPFILHRIEAMARLQYESRYLLKKMKGQPSPQD